MRLHLVYCLLFVLITLQPFVAQNYSKDVRMGEKAAKQVEQEMGFYKHDSLERVISSIGYKLVSNLKKKPEGFEFTFHLVDQAEPNAFALPGGYIYVTRGILPLVQNEDELAGIIGHEIIHVVNRHSVKQFHREILPAVLKIPGNLINAITFSHLGNILNVPITFITQPFVAKYSRKHETEADEEGMKLAANSGYRPEALAQVLARMHKGLKAMTGEVEKKSYLADHPYTPKRVANIDKLSKKVKSQKASPVYGSEENFLSKFNGLYYGSNPKYGAFVDSLFIQPELNFSFLIPSAWSGTNTPEVVAASNKEQDALIALSLYQDKAKKTPHDIGTEMQKKIRTSSTTKLEFAGDTTIHSLTAYLIRVRSEQKGKPLVLEMIWLSHDQNVYQFSGISALERRKAVAKALRSFKPATETEHKLIKATAFKITKTNTNEDLSEVSKRTRNVLGSELTLLFNDVQKETNLPAGKAFKIAELVPYRNAP